LEHDPFWAKRVQKTLKQYGLTNVEVCLSELRNFGGYSWYAVQKERLPKDFALVVCDGPPEYVPGGRFGLLPEMKPYLKPGCVILLDDAMRAGEQQALARWCSELGTDYTILGSARPFARLTLPNGATTPV